MISTFRVKHYKNFNQKLNVIEENLTITKTIVFH